MGWLDALSVGSKVEPHLLTSEKSKASFSSLKLPERPPTTDLAGTAALIHSYLEQSPPDTDSVLELIASTDRAQLGALRAAFQNLLPPVAEGADPDQRVARYLESRPNITPERREMIILMLSGRAADADVASLFAALENHRLTSGSTTSAAAEQLRAIFLVQLGDTPERIAERIEAFNARVNRRRLLDQWLQESLESPERERLRESLAAWDLSISGRAGARTLLFDRWITNNLSETQRTSFESFVTANLASQPDQLRSEITRVFGERSRFADYLAARRDGNAPLASAVELIDGMQTGGATAREILVHLMQLPPEQRTALVDAYHARFGDAAVTNPAERWRTFVAALTARASSTTPDPWTPTMRRGLERLLSGAVVDRAELDLELTLSALGVEQGTRRGDRLQLGLADLNFLLRGRTVEQRNDLLRQVEETLVTRGILERRNAERPGEALFAYLRTHSDRPAEEFRVLSLNRPTLDEMRRLASRVATASSDPARREAAEALDRLNRDIEAQRLAFRRSEEDRIAGRPVTPVTLTYFDQHVIRTHDRARQWGDAVEGLFTRGAVSDERVTRFISLVQGDNARTDVIRGYAAALDGDISTGLMTVRASVTNLRGSFRSFDEVSYSWRNLGLCGMFAHMSGTRDEALRAISRDQARVWRSFDTFVDTQRRTGDALAALQRQNDESLEQERLGRLAELFGDPAAQERYNRAEVAFQGIAPALNSAHSETVKQRLKMNSDYMGQLQQANARLAKCIQTLDGYEEAIIKTGVIVGATVVAVGTGGTGLLAFGGGVLAGTGTGFGLSVYARGMQAGLKTGDVTNIKWDAVGADTVDAFIASVGGKAGANVTSARVASAGSRTAIMKAHVAGNLRGAGVMFAGNTGKNAATVYAPEISVFGNKIFEGEMSKAEKALGRPLNETERHEILEKHRLTRGQLGRDAFTYLATAYVGGKLSGATHAYGGQFAANGKFVDLAPGLRTKALSTTNFVGQTGVAAGGNGLNYLYYQAGWEKEFHFDAGLLVAPVGNISFKGSKGHRAHADAVEPAAVPRASLTEGVPHPTTRPVAEPIHPTRVQEQAALIAHGQTLETQARSMPAGAERAQTHAEGRRLLSQAADAAHADAHAALVEAHSMGDPVRIAEAEGAFLRTRRAALDAEHGLIEARAAQVEHALPEARTALHEQVADSRRDLLRRRTAHAADELATHERSFPEPNPEQTVERRQLEHRHAEAALAEHIDRHGASPGGAEAPRRAALEAEVARTTTELSAPVPSAPDGASPARGRGRRRAGQSEETRVALEESRARLATEEGELARFRAEHAENPNWQNDPALRARSHTLEDNVRTARRAHEDTMLTRREADLREQLSSPDARRRARAERELAGIEGERDARATRRAQEDLDLFRSRNPNAADHPALREQLHRLEDQVHSRAVAEATNERARLQRALEQVPDTVGNVRRRNQLEQKIARTDLRLAELTYDGARTQTARHRAELVEQDMSSTRRRPVEDGAWETRRQLLSRELAAREALAELRLDHARRRPQTTEQARERVVQRELELHEARAASQQLGTETAHGPRISYEQAVHQHQVLAEPLRRANAMYEAYRTALGDNAPQTRDALRFRDRVRDGRAFERSRAEVNMLEHELALRRAEDSAVRRARGLADTDPVPMSRERERRSTQRVEEELAASRARFRELETQQGSRWGRKLLGLGAAAMFLWDAKSQLDQLSGIWDGLEYIENDNGYMYGRSTNGGPIDEMMYSRMTTQDPAQYLDTARALLRDTYGSLLSHEDIERFARRIVVSGNGGLPSQLSIRQIITEADSLATDAATIRTHLTTRLNPPAVTTPQHGVGGFFDIERLRAEGHIKAPQ